MGKALQSYFIVGGVATNEHRATDETFY